MAVLVLLFIVVPIAELAVIIQVGQSLGVVTTLVLLVGVSIGGATLVRAQGMVTIARARARLAAGQMPEDEMVAGIAIVIAGALMLTPGFITDAVGLALLLPPVRHLLVAVVRRRFRGRIQAQGFGPGFGEHGPRSGWDQP